MDPAATGLRLYLLGGFRVIVGSHAVEDGAWRRERAAALVKILALAPRHRLHREQITELLWPDSAPGTGANALHQVLHVARRILQSNGAPALSVLQLRQEIVSLAPDTPPWIDADEFQSATARARSDRDPVALEAALALYRGELLPDDRYAEWTVARREALQRAYLDALLDLARLQAEAGAHQQTIDALRRVVELEPTHEDAQAELMRVLALAGRRSSALRQYRTLQDSLLQELDAAPQAATRQLYEEIVDGRLGTPASVRGEAEPIPPHRQVPATGTLPLEVNSFVGRAHDVADVCTLLESTRVLTLTGAGGCGKTRLAVRIAGALRATNSVEVSFADLAGLQQAALVPQAVAAALGIAEQSGRPLLETLIDHLRTRRLVLLLDNCEHVIDSSARLVQALAAACPHLRLLCTSREPLHIPGELVWRVSSLSIPDIQRLPPLDALLQYESIRLFRDRAQAVMHSFVVDEGNARAVAHICHRLDGMPLALELAAARVTVLSPQQMVERLDDCFTLLSHGSRTAFSRQQTMKALLDWSYDLLATAERTLLRRLAVFAGTFDLAAVEAIAGVQALAAADVLDLLQNLVDRSLVVALNTDGSVRYRLLEPIRQYAGLQLQAAHETTLFSNRHTRWYLDLARAADEDLWGPRHRAAVDRLEGERENIRAALGWCAAHEVTHGLELARTQWQFWLLRGYMSEGLRWLEQLLDDSAAPPGARAPALLNAWALAARQGNYRATVTAHVEQSIAIYRDLGDSLGLARAIHQRGIQAYMRGQYAAARAYFEQSHELSASIGHIAGRALATYGLGIIAWARGAHEAAQAAMESALHLFQEDGEGAPFSTFLNVGLMEIAWDGVERAITVQEETWILLRRIEAPVAAAYVLANLGNVARLRGRVAEAERYLDESITAFTAAGDSAGLSQALGQKGNFCRWSGRYEEAHDLLERSLALRHELGERRGAGRTLNNLGMLALEAGQPEEARARFGESLALFTEMGDKPGLTATHENEGHLALRAGDVAAARAAYDHSLALAHDMGGVARSIACNLRHRGLAELAAGDTRSAAASFEASRAHFLEMGDALSVATLDRLVQLTGR